MPADNRHAIDAGPASAAAVQYCTGLGNVLVKIHCINTHASSFLKQLYFPPPPAQYTKTYLLHINKGGIYVDDQAQHNLSGDLPRDFISILSYLLAAKQTAGLLFHAAALISPKGHLYLFPGTSKVGKTTVSVGLALNGWDILTDELVLLTTDHKIGGFLRPVHVRKDSIQLLPFTHEQRTLFIATKEGALLPASVLPGKKRLFAPDSSVANILFLQRSAPFCATFLSKAETLTRIMGVNTNGRNFDGNGFYQAAEWVRHSNITSAALNYHHWSSVADYIEKMECR